MIKNIHRYSRTKEFTYEVHYIREMPPCWMDTSHAWGLDRTRGQILCRYSWTNWNKGYQFQIRMLSLEWLGHLWYNSINDTLLYHRNHHKYSLKMEYPRLLQATEAATGFQLESQMGPHDSMIQISTRPLVGIGPSTILRSPSLQRSAEITYQH